LKFTRQSLVWRYLIAAPRGQRRNYGVLAGRRVDIFMGKKCRHRCC